MIIINTEYNIFRFNYIIHFYTAYEINIEI